MANELDNLVLMQLREIRATLAEHSGELVRISECFAQVDKRFDRLERRFDEFHMVVSHTLNLGTTVYLKSQESDQRHGLSEGEQRRLSERLDRVERRLSDLEEEDESRDRRDLPGCGGTGGTQKEALGAPRSLVPAAPLRTEAFQ